MGTSTAPTSQQPSQAEADLLRVRRSGLAWINPDSTRLGDSPLDGEEAPARVALSQATRLGRTSAVRDFALKHRDILCGSRNLMYPLIALNSGSMTKRARHILSQRTVAGTMDVQPPFVPDAKDNKPKT